MPSTQSFFRSGSENFADVFPADSMIFYDGSGHFGSTFQRKFYAVRSCHFVTMCKCSDDCGL